MYSNVTINSYWSLMNYRATLITVDHLNHGVLKVLINYKQSRAQKFYSDI